jgi:hypothetical protein
MLTGNFVGFELITYLMVKSLREKAREGEKRASWPIPPRSAECPSSDPCRLGHWRALSFVRFPAFLAHPLLPHSRASCRTIDARSHPSPPTETVELCISHTSGASPGPVSQLPIGKKASLKEIRNTICTLHTFFNVYRGFNTHAPFSNRLEIVIGVMT